jgi:hypothetical protein
MAQSRINPFFPVTNGTLEVKNDFLLKGSTICPPPCRLFFKESFVQKRTRITPPQVYENREPAGSQKYTDRPNSIFYFK